MTRIDPALARAPQDLEGCGAGSQSDTVEQDDFNSVSDATERCSLSRRISDDNLIDGESQRDRILLELLDDYLAKRRRGPVDRSAFIRKCVLQYPSEEISTQLPGLLNSVDDLRGLALDQPDAQTDIPRDESVPTELGDFEILEELGRGGMGIVYRARERSLNRVVALKVLPQSVMLQRRQVARFLLEAQAASQLDHENIVPIYSTRRESGVYCYSMRLVDGTSLDRLIGDRSFDFNRAATWMLQTAQALAHAHRNQIIHRDIKPSNLLIDAAGKLWVTDFGLARWTQNGSLTQSGTIVGTRHYMSPEQATGNPMLVDHRSDQYGVGVTFYELLTGCKLHEESLDIELVRYRGNVAIPSPSMLNRSIPKDLETILLKTLSVDPDDRYPTCEDLAADLQCFLGGQPISARRASLLDRVGKSLVRHRKVVAGATIIAALALLMSLAAITWFMHQQRQLRMALAQADNNLDVAGENLDRAQAHFKQTREVLDHFGLTAAEGLRGVAGAETLREQLVKDLLRYYEGFVAAAEDDPQLRTELATTHLRAARIIDEVGASERALAAYQRALELFSRLEPNPELRLSRGDCLNRIGLLLSEQGRFEAAKDSFQQAIEMLSPLAGGDSQVARTLASVTGNQALLLASQGQRQQAEETFFRAIELLPKTTARSWEDSRVIAMIWNNLGSLSQHDDVAAAIEFNAKAIDELRRGLEISQQDKIDQESTGETSELQRSLAISLNNQASLVGRLDRTDQALAMYVESIELYRDLVAQFPMAAKYTEELAITYNNYGRTLDRSGDSQQARLALQRSKDLLQVLTQRRPDEPRYRDAMTGVESNLKIVADPKN